MVQVQAADPQTLDGANIRLKRRDLQESDRYKLQNSKTLDSTNIKEVQTSD